MIPVPPIPQPLLRDMDEGELQDCLKELVGPSLWYAAEYFTGSNDWTTLTLDDFLLGPNRTVHEDRIHARTSAQALEEGYQGIAMAIVPVEIAEFALRLQRLATQALQALDEVLVPEHEAERAEFEALGNMPGFEDLVQSVQAASNLLAGAGLPDDIEPNPQGVRAA